MAMAGVTMSAGAASATVIYSDNFVQASGTELNGQPVQASAAYAGGTANAVWAGSTTITTTGSGAYEKNGGNYIYLPFTPQQNYIYTLTATISITASTPEWDALGFASTSPLITGYGSLYSWGLVSGTGSNQPQFFPGVGTAGGPIYFGTTSDNGKQTLIITLNTMSAKWTSSAVIQGDLTNPSTTITYSTPPAIKNVGFGYNYDGTISAFSLTATAPEPATLGLLAVGALGLLLLGRKRENRLPRG
ncbi:MAG: PEP-CTERM sorting domain-containing protein [Phycisphaerales bacterium]|nr:PEP-CTERM sorting domain-containing protein [Phycisphaerales bacterium]